MRLFDASPGAWGTADKPKVLKCPGCGQLVYVDSKEKLDAHWKSDHKDNIYVRPTTGSAERPRLLGLKWYEEIKMIFQDYPKGIMFYTMIVLLLTLIVSRVIELR
jgi:hypothetical protein